MSQQVFEKNQLQYWLSRLESDEFKRLMDKIPISEVTHILKHTGQNEDEKEVNRLKMMVTLRRLCHRVCNKCSRNTNPLELLTCPKCELTWYCNSTCISEDEHKHKLWCCRVDAPPDDGPMATPLETSSH